MFALLTQLYNAQGNINDIPTLQSLVDLFTRWAKSNLLKPAQTNTIITIWIPTILKHIAQLQFSAQIPTTPSGNLPTIPAPGTVVLSAQDQNNIFAALKYRYDNRIVAIQPLLDLQALLTAWLNSALLTNDQNNTISSVWLAQIAKELDALRKLSSLGFDVNNPGTGTTTGTGGGTSGAPGGATSGTTGSAPGSTTGGTITTKLPQVTVDNFPQPGSVSFLPKSIIDQLIAQLLALINSRNSNNQDALNKLRLLLLGMLGNGTLTPGQQNDLKNAQSSIDNDLALLQLRAQLANAANLSGQALLDWLNNILGTLQGKTLDAATQNSIFALLQKAYNGRIKTIDALSKLNDLLSRWANSNLLSPAQTATIQQQWIPTIMLELSTLQLLQAIANALAQSDYATKLASLKAIITTAQGLAQIDPSVQTAYYNALITVYNQRQPLAATLAQLIDLLNSALTSNLLNDQQKAALQPIVASLGIIARINALMAMTDYAQCIGGHGQLLKDVQGQSFAATVQNLYAQAIMQAFNQRIGQPLDQLRGLSTILNTAQTTPLLAPAQQAFVKAMIATLTVEIMILDALSRSDYGAQLDGLLDMIFTFQNTRVTDARTQNLFFEALKTVFSRRVSQFAPSITDDSNLDKLHLLLLNSEESTLLNAQQQLVAGAYGDIVTIEQMILDVRNQAAYADRLAGMNRVLNSSIGRAFDPASNDLAFTVITALYNDRVNNPAQLNALKQALTTAATSPLLNFDQQQQVR
ncbi:hypothetical protein EBZ39_13640, partial [bacterium]|nr:hypothetical protein [bacterium]